MAESVHDALYTLLGHCCLRDSEVRSSALVLQKEIVDVSDQAGGTEGALSKDDYIASLEAEIELLRNALGGAAGLSDIRDPWITEYFRERPQITPPRERLLGYEIPYAWKCVVESLLGRVRAISNERS